MGCWVQRCREKERADELAKHGSSILPLGPEALSKTKSKRVAGFLFHDSNVSYRYNQYFPLLNREKVQRV